LSNSRDVTVLLFRPELNPAVRSVAPDDIHASLLAVASSEGHGLGGAARRVGSFGRCDSRRAAMCPVPGNVISAGWADVGRYCCRGGCHGFAIWHSAVGEISRPEEPAVVVESPMMPKRVSERSTGHRMGRRKASSMHRSRPGECFVRGNQKRCCANDREKNPKHSIHGTHQFVGYWALRTR